MLDGINLHYEFSVDSEKWNIFILWAKFCDVRLPTSPSGWVHSPSLLLSTRPCYSRTVTSSLTPNHCPLVLVRSQMMLAKFLWCLTAYKFLRLSQIPIDAFVNQIVALKYSDKLSDDRPSMLLCPCALTNDVSKLLFKDVFIPGLSTFFQCGLSITKVHQQHNLAWSNGFSPY